MKKKKGLIISVIVLTIVMLCSFIGGGVLVARGAVDVVRDINLPEKLSQFGINNGLNTAVNYLKYISGSVTIDYNDEYLSSPFVIDGVSADNIHTLVIENIGYDITVIGSQREDISLSFTGKYPDGINGEKLFSCNTDAVSSTLTISAADMPCYFDSSVGSVTICVPDKSDWDIIVKDCTGDSEISNVTVSSLSIENYAGELAATEITAEYLSIFSAAGDFDFYGNFAGCTVDNLLGSAVFESRVVPTESCNVKNCMGEIDIMLPADTVLHLTKSNSYADIRCNLTESESGVKFAISNFFGQIAFGAV